jgi:hypothetical protein
MSTRPGQEAILPKLKPSAASDPHIDVSSCAARTIAATSTRLQRLADDVDSRNLRPQLKFLQFGRKLTGGVDARADSAYYERDDHHQRERDP